MKIRINHIALLTCLLFTTVFVTSCGGSGANVTIGGGGTEAGTGGEAGGTGAGAGALQISNTVFANGIAHTGTSQNFTGVTMMGPLMPSGGGTTVESSHIAFDESLMDFGTLLSDQL